MNSDEQQLILLACSLGALGMGPLIYAWAQRRSALARALDGFVFIAIAGLVFVDVLPEVLAHTGWWGLGFVALGLWGPSLFERAFSRLAHRTHMLTLLLSAVGLIVHTMFDGAVLTGEGHDMLALAVVIHRVPVGLAVWWLLRPTWGRGLPTAMLVGMGAFTLLGFWLSDGLMTDSFATEFAALQAFVAGSILHVIFNRPHLDPALESHHSGPDRAEGIGNLLGLAVFLALLGNELAHGQSALDGLGPLLDLSLAAAPPLLLAYAAGGLVAAFMPESSMAWLARGGSLGQAARGVLVGLPLPVCSCGVVPLYRSFVERGAPPAAAIAFLIATPELGLDAILISIPLLGAEMTIARIVTAALVAVLVGWGLGRFMHLRETGDSCGHNHMPKMEGSVMARARAGLRYGFGDLVDATAPWIILGIGIASVAQPLLEQPALQQIPAPIQVVAFALLGLPIYVCATGSTPIVAVMLAAGVAPGAALAFLLTGPATNPATFGMLARMHGSNAAIAFGAATGGLAIVSGLLLNATGLAIDPVAVLHDIFPGPIAWTSLVVLVLVFLTSLARLGARQFVAELRLGRAAAH